MESFAFPDRINLISTDIKQKCSKLLSFSLESRSFFVCFFVNSWAKKTQKLSLKLSTSAAKSKFYVMFLGFY